MKKVVLTLSVFLTLSGFAYAAYFFAALTGAQEVPARETPATGEIEVAFDRGFTEAQVYLTVSGYMGALTGAHFHCARPGENGPIVVGLFGPGPFPVGDLVSGTLTNSNFLPGANCVPIIGRPVNNIAALAFAMREGLIYVNVHTTVFPGGEIRAQLFE